MNAILEQDIELFAQQFALKDELRKKTILIGSEPYMLRAILLHLLWQLSFYEVRLIN